MSLEETIAANTAAVVGLTAALAALAAMVSEGHWSNDRATVNLVNQTPIVTNNTAAQTVGKVAGDLAAAAVGLTGAAPLASDAQAVVQVTVTDVLNAATQLIAKTDKATLSATLKEFNAKTIAAISPDSLKPALDKINAAIAAAA